MYNEIENKLHTYLRSLEHTEIAWEKKTNRYHVNSDSVLKFMRCNNMSKETLLLLTINGHTCSGKNFRTRTWSDGQMHANICTHARVVVHMWAPNTYTHEHTHILLRVLMQKLDTCQDMRLTGDWTSDLEFKFWTPTCGGVKRRKNYCTHTHAT